MQQYIAKFELVRGEAQVEESVAKERFWLGLRDQERRSLGDKLDNRYPDLLYRTNKQQYVTLGEMIKILRAEKFFEGADAQPISFRARATKLSGRAKTPSFLINADPVAVNTVAEEQSDDEVSLKNACLAICAASVPGNVGVGSLQSLLPAVVAAVNDADSRGLPSLSDNWLGGLSALAAALEHSY